MPKTRMVQKNTEETAKRAQTMSKEEYRRIKQGRGPVADTVDQPAIVDAGK